MAKRKPLETSKFSMASFKALLSKLDPPLRTEIVLFMSLRELGHDPTV